MAHLERDRLKSWLWDMLWILYLQFSCTLYCQWHMHAHLSLFVSINNVRFLNTALLIGRSWDTRYFKAAQAVYADSGCNPQVCRVFPVKAHTFYYNLL